MRWLLAALILSACEGMVPPPPPPIDSTDCSPMAAHVEALGCKQAEETDRQCRRQLANGLRIDIPCLRSARSCQEVASCK